MTAPLSRFRQRSGIALAVFLLAAASALAQLVVPAAPNPTASPQSASTSFTADLFASAQWKDTGLDLQPGDSVQISASGQLQYSDAKQPATPDGLARGWKDLLRILPLNEAGRGALIARIGDSEAARPFLLGASHTFRAPTAGRLFLGINQMSIDTADGSFHVEAKILARGASASAPPQPVATSVPGFTLALLDQIPRRVNDDRGNLGDMTNFILIGSEERLRQAFQQAGWVLVDRTKEEAVLHGLLASVTKESYVQMPMSELYLFGRPQDYGFALADPYEVVLQRHHNRVWKSPYTVAGQAVWVGAGTHDIGLEKDQRNPKKLTHKIDPEIDKEREFIADSLTSTGLVAARMYLLPSQPVGETHTATGGSFYSDGRVLVMELRAASESAATRARAPFSAVFCSVLEREHPDAGPWGPCSEYIEAPSAERVALGAIPRNYRLGIVSGVLTACFGDATAFREGRKHLHDAYGLTVDLIPTPNHSSVENGRAVARFLRDAYAKDGRKFILLGYSKGAPDILEGLAKDPGAARAVAALITVAGAIGGSPLADLLPDQAQRWFEKINLGGCQGDLYDAFRSLRRDVRRRFLTQHPDLGVPVYTISAVSTRSQTSRFLLEAWQLLSLYGQPQDSELLESDTRYPGGHDLGALHADHFAVAIPLEDLNTPGLSQLVNHNHFPRSALLEALVRYVTADLAPAPRRGNL